MYKYGVLRRDNSRVADEYNDTLLGPTTFGIEVTDPVYRVRCGLGFIDHRKRGDTEMSAVEVALECALPPKGAILITERPDKDSFGAMGVLTLRAEGRSQEIDRFLVASIGGLDRLGSIERFREAYPELIEAFQDGLEIQALNIITREVGRIDIEARIHDVMRILTGRATRHELEQIVKFRTYTQRTNFETETYGAITFINAMGEYEAARNWADRQGFPVAIIFDPGYNRNVTQPHRRYTTISQKEYFDRDGFEIAINHKEAGKRGISLEGLAEEHSLWGGHGRIVSSPLGSGRETVLSKIEIVQTAYDFVR